MIFRVIAFLFITFAFTNCYAEVICVDEKNLVAKMGVDNPVSLMHEKYADIFFVATRENCQSFKVGLNFIVRYIDWKDRKHFNPNNILVDDLAKYLAWDLDRFEQCAIQLDKEETNKLKLVYGKYYRRYASDFEEIRLN